RVQGREGRLQQEPARLSVPRVGSRAHHHDPRGVDDRAAELAAAGQGPQRSLGHRELDQDQLAEGRCVMPTAYPACRVAAAHVAPVFLDLEKTVAKTQSLIDEAARHGAQLVAFPEAYIPAFPVWSALAAPIHNHGWFRRLAANAVRCPGPALDRIGVLICGENTNPLARFALMAEGEQVHVATYPPVWPTRDPRDGGNYDLAAAIRIRAGAHSFEAKVFTIVVSGFMDAAMRDELGA